MSALYFTQERFLDDATITGIVGEMKRSHAAAAPVYGQAKAGGTVNPHVRKVSRLSMSTATRDKIVSLLMEAKDALSMHFGVALNHCEEPQFLRYETGDFFVAHQDGNTPLVYDHTRFRKISISICLSQPGDASDPGTYGGGDLVLYGKPMESGERAVQGRGTLVAFRSETTHEVLPVSHGERYAIVSWYRSDNRK
ncbi:MAG TPA: 2OG-Fe(II) oxygenase [Verrucomicrobiae bacterium]|nr:2OG-Fe(II) oxygenase [Verrucomicrobiae bacterium]